MDVYVEQTGLNHINFFASYTASDNSPRHTTIHFKDWTPKIFQIAQTAAISVSHFQTSLNANDLKWLEIG